MIELLVVSHCILNRAAKVAQDEAALVQERKLRDGLLELTLERDVQLLQLPCPETTLFGTRRWGHVKDQFDFPFFRRECRRMLEPFLLQIEDYCSNPERFSVLGIVSVEGSPSCGIRLTCRGNWGGELSEDAQSLSDTVSTLRASEEPGVYMEVLREALSQRNLSIPIITMEEAIDLLTLEKQGEASS